MSRVALDQQDPWIGKKIDAGWHASLDVYVTGRCTYHGDDGYRIDAFSFSAALFPYAALHK